MKNFKLISLALIGLTVMPMAKGAGTDWFTWKYYRPGNTGIGGDSVECIHLSPNGDPWFGANLPTFEEGGISKFIQAENRWQNISNVDYEAFGSANVVGNARVNDIVTDGVGNLWMAHWHGVLKMNLAKGPSSLVRYDSDNSNIPGGITKDILVAPDGSIWASAYSAHDKPGGLSRYDRTTDTWTTYPNHGGYYIAAQSKPGGGYYIWCSAEGYSSAPMERLDVSTNQWTSYPAIAGNPSHLVSNDSTDAGGNLWMRRYINNQFDEQLSTRSVAGVWTNPPVPPANGPVAIAALRPTTANRAIMVDGFMHLRKFNGTSWDDLGEIPHQGFVDDLETDAAGNVWLCGSSVGGALKRDVNTGHWQRHRITNNSQYDYFNNDISIAPNGKVFITGNAGPTVGGMMEFDGTRWKTYVTELGYGLSGPWPFFGSPQSESIYVRPSNGKVVVNPINAFTHEFDGTNWNQIPGGFDQMRTYCEDSLGRLWAAPHYGGLWIMHNGTTKDQEFPGWAVSIQRDPSTPGAIWCSGDNNLMHSNGVDRFVTSAADFPSPYTGLNGLAVDGAGYAWVGMSDVWGGTAHGLAKVSPTTAAVTPVSLGSTWPFPLAAITPRVVTPDGKIWFTYFETFEVLGLGWFDGKKTGYFPAPPNGEWVFGGLPHGGIFDIEVKPTPGGYELWMSCMTRGIAVLQVRQKKGGPAKPVLNPPVSDPIN